MSEARHANTRFRNDEENRCRFKHQRKEIWIDMQPGKQIAVRESCCSFNLTKLSVYQHALALDATNS